MFPAIHLSLSWSDWLLFFQHYLTMSLLSIGGATGTLPEMYRFLVAQHHWLTETQFNASVAIAKAAPGPNVLFVVLLAWNVGLNSGSTEPGSLIAGFFALFVAMTGVLIPSSTLTYFASGWLHRNAASRGVRAFKQGLAPIVVALLVATGWVMASGYSVNEWHLWVVTAVVVLIVWRTRIHLLWLLGAGAVLGWFGVI